MRFIFYDFETTGRNYNWDQIIQVGAVITNETLEEIDSFECSCILKPGIVPEPAALLVNKRIPGEHTNLSHYNLVKLMWKKFNQWIEEYGPLAFFGYNSINFDEEFLRRTFYKNLFPPFLTSSTNYGVSNKRGDIINLARSANHFYPGTLKTSFNEKGKEIFKLEQLASDNIISDQGNNLTFHDALDDTRATIGIAKIIKNKAPILWESGLKTMSKIEALDFIKEEEFVISAEFYFGLTRFYVVSYICEDTNGNIKAFDLRNDPKQFMRLGDNEFKEIINNTTPKILRTVTKNKHPILMKGEFANAVIGYETIGFDELKRRAKFLSENNEILSKLKRFIMDDQKEYKIDQLDKEPEESIYAYGFANKSQKLLMQEFHEETWEKKLEISKRFIDLATQDFNSIQRGKIYSEFSKILLFEENQNILEKDEKARIKKKLADRVFYPDTDTVKSPWNNINRAFMEIENLGAKLEDEGKVEDLKFLYKIKDLLENIENEFK